MKEVEKMVAAQEESMTLSGFLDWLSDNGYAICEEKEFEEPDATEALAIVAGIELPPNMVIRWWPRRKSNERLLADFFEIDLDKVEEERRVILEELADAH